jgi:predicted nucleotidyltransferase
VLGLFNWGAGDKTHVTVINQKKETFVRQPMKADNARGRIMTNRMKTGTALKVVSKISDIRRELNERFTVKRIGVFGSSVRGDEGPESDVDIIVELVEPTFDNYMDLKFRLEAVLGRPVDLVMADTLKPRLKPIIEQEVVYA